MRLRKKVLETAEPLKLQAIPQHRPKWGALHNLVEAVLDLFRGPDSEVELSIKNKAHCGPSGQSHLQHRLQLWLPDPERHHVVRGVANLVVLQKRVPDHVHLAPAAHRAEVRLECAPALHERLAGDDACADAGQFRSERFVLRRYLGWCCLSVGGIVLLI